MNRFRAAVMLALLRLVYPQGMRGARAAVLLPIPASAPMEADGSYPLMALLTAPQIYVAPAHPSQHGRSFAQSLGSVSVRIPIDASPAH